MRGKSPLLLALRVAIVVIVASLVFGAPVMAAPPAVEKVRVQTHNGFTRVVLETTAPIEPNLFTMGKPHRLVIDLPELQWRIPRPSGFVDSPLVRKFSFGLFQPGVSRLVLDLSGPTQVVRRKPSRSGRMFFYEIDLAYLQSSLPPEPIREAGTHLGRVHGSLPSRASKSENFGAFPNGEHIKSSKLRPVEDSFPVIELPVASTVDPATKSVFQSRSFDPSKAQFDTLGDVLAAALGNDAPAPDETVESPVEIEVVALEPEAIPDLAPERTDVKPIDEPVADVEPEIEKLVPEKPNRPPLRIVIDPGHGGRDPGTGADSGISEKDINLAFAKTLAGLLEIDPKYDVFLTRDADTRVKLDKRVQFARRKEADLFISIHADWSMNERAKGATAYTLSEEASVEALDSIATKRNEVGRVAGVDLAAEREDVARLLVDLARRETQARSLKFAELVVGEVAKETPVLRRPLRKDSFHVLKAPDMPSVLLELGFLSNETDRQRLTSEVWRLKTAEAVKRAIDEFRIATGSRDFATKR